MTEIDDRLRAYRPSGPPPDLRARILRQVEAPRAFTVREWLPALAAAALIVIFYSLGVGVRAELALRLAVPDDLRPVEQSLSDDIGGLR